MMKLAQARRHALSLADTTEEPHHDYSSFRVRGRIFCTVPPDGEHLHIMVGEEQREQALALYPGFLEKLWWGSKVLGVRATLPAADPAVIRDLLTQAWTARSAKKPSPR